MAHKIKIFIIIIIVIIIIIIFDSMLVWNSVIIEQQ